MRKELFVRRYRCRSRKIWGLRTIFGRISPNLPETFSGRIFTPTKIMKTFFGMTSKNATLGAIFDRIFREFAQIFRDFATIFRDCTQIFTECTQIFDKSKRLGMPLYFFHPRLLHHCKKQHWRGAILKMRNNDCMSYFMENRFAMSYEDSLARNLPKHEHKNSNDGAMHGFPQFRFSTSAPSSKNIFYKFL